MKNYYQKFIVNLPAWEGMGEITIIAISAREWLPNLLFSSQGWTTEDGKIATGYQVEKVEREFHKWLLQNNKAIH